MKYIQAFGNGFTNPLGWKGGHYGDQKLTPPQIVLICSTSLMHILHDAVQSAIHAVHHSLWWEEYNRRGREISDQPRDNVYAKIPQKLLDDFPSASKKGDTTENALKFAIGMNLSAPWAYGHFDFNEERYPDFCKDFEQQGLTAEQLNPIRDAYQAEFQSIYGDLEEPEPHHLGTGLFATFLTSFPQGAATYAAAYGIGLLCITYLGGLAGTITHGVASAFVGLWLGSGRAWSGIASGLLVGASAFAIQVYGLQLLQELLQSFNIGPFSELELHLVGGAATILATILLESISLVTTRIWEKDTWQQFYNGDYYGNLLIYNSEYPFHDWVDSKIIVPLERICGAEWTKPNPIRE